MLLSGVVARFINGSSDFRSIGSDIDHIRNNHFPERPCRIASQLGGFVSMSPWTLPPCAYRIYQTVGQDASHTQTPEGRAIWGRGLLFWA